MLETVGIDLIQGRLLTDLDREKTETLGVPEDDVVQMNRRLAAPDHSLNAPLRIDGDGEWQDWLVDEDVAPVLVGEFGGREVGAEELARLHHLAHEHCFIANSVKTQISVE